MIGFILAVRSWECSVNSIEKLIAPREMRCSQFVTECINQGTSHFISVVCWKSESATMLAANSQGTIKVLVLAPWTSSFSYNSWRSLLENRVGENFQKFLNWYSFWKLSSLDFLLPKTIKKWGWCVDYMLQFSIRQYF